VTSKPRRGGRRYAPYAFTEQGVAMLSSVLTSDRAIAVNIQIMRAFVRMRELLISNKDLAQKLDQLEARIEKKLAAHDEAIAAILFRDPRAHESDAAQTPQHRLHRRSRGEVTSPSRSLYSPAHASSCNKSRR